MRLDERQPRICLPVETKVRELDGKFWLAIHLAGEGYSVFLGDSVEMKKQLHVMDPDLFFGLGLVKQDNDKRVRLFDRLRDAGRRILILSTEGGAFRGNKTRFLKRISSEVLSRADKYLAWGQKSAEFVSNVPNVNPDQINVTGPPSFDLLHRSVRSYYEERGMVDPDLRDENFILVNTNFTQANPHVSDRNQKNANEENNDLPEFVRKMMDSMLECVGKIARKFSDRTIVIRPHPGEDHDTYRERFRDVPNVRVIYRGTVRHWLISASVVIHNNCTTGVEGVLSGTPVLAYSPEEFPDYEHLSNKVSHTFRSQGKLIQAVKDCIKGNTIPYLMNEDQKQTLQEYLRNLDGKAADRITETVQDLHLQRSDAQLPPDYGDVTKYTLREALRNYLGDTFFSYLEHIRQGKSTTQYLNRAADSLHHLLRGEKVSLKSEQKFPSLKRSELMERLTAFQQEVEMFNHIDIEPVDQLQNVFKIYQSAE